MISVGTTYTADTFRKLFKNINTEYFNEGYRADYQNVFKNIKAGKVAKTLKDLLTGKIKKFSEFLNYATTFESGQDGEAKQIINALDDICEKIRQTFDTDENKVAMLRQYVMGTLMSYVENNFDEFYKHPLGKADKFLDIKQMSTNLRNQILYRALFMLIEQNEQKQAELMNINDNEQSSLPSWLIDEGINQDDINNLLKDKDFINTLLNPQIKYDKYVQFVQNILGYNQEHAEVVNNVKAQIKQKLNKRMDTIIEKYYLKDSFKGLNTIDFLDKINTITENDICVNDKLNIAERNTFMNNVKNFIIEKKQDGQFNINFRQHKEEHSGNYIDNIDVNGLGLNLDVEITSDELQYIFMIYKNDLNNFLPEAYRLNLGSGVDDREVVKYFYNLLLVKNNVNIADIKRDIKIDVNDSFKNINKDIIKILKDFGTDPSEYKNKSTLELVAKIKAFTEENFKSLKHFADETALNKFRLKFNKMMASRMLLKNLEAKEKNEDKKFDDDNEFPLSENVINCLGEMDDRKLFNAVKDIIEERVPANKKNDFYKIATLSQLLRFGLTELWENNKNSEIYVQIRDMILTKHNDVRDDYTLLERYRGENDEANIISMINDDIKNRMIGDVQLIKDLKLENFNRNTKIELKADNFKELTSEAYKALVKKYIDFLNDTIAKDRITNFDTENEKEEYVRSILSFEKTVNAGKQRAFTEAIEKLNEIKLDDINYLVENDTFFLEDCIQKIQSSAPELLPEVEVQSNDKKYENFFNNIDNISKDELKVTIEDMFEQIKREMKQDKYKEQLETVNKGKVKFEALYKKAADELSNISKKHKTELKITNKNNYDELISDIQKLKDKFKPEYNAEKKKERETVKSTLKEQIGNIVKEAKSFEEAKNKIVKPTYNVFKVLKQQSDQEIDLLGNIKMDGQNTVYNIFKDKTRETLAIKDQKDMVYQAFEKIKTLSELIVFLNKQSKINLSTQITNYVIAQKGFLDGIKNIDTDNININNKKFIEKLDNSISTVTKSKSMELRNHIKTYFSIQSSATDKILENILFSKPSDIEVAINKLINDLEKEKNKGELLGEKSDGKIKGMKNGIYIHEYMYLVEHSPDFRKALDGFITYFEEIADSEDKNKINGLSNLNDYVRTLQQKIYNVEQLHQNKIMLEDNTEMPLNKIQENLPGNILKFVINEIDGNLTKINTGISINEGYRESLKDGLISLIKRYIKDNKTGSLQEVTGAILNGKVSKAISKMSAKSDSQVLSLDDVIKIKYGEQDIEPEELEKIKEEEIATMSHEIQMLVEDNLIPVATNKVSQMDIIKVARNIARKA
jgi:hypothetical protein